MPIIRPTHALISCVAAPADRPFRFFSLYSIIPLVSTSDISSVWLASVADQSGLCINGSVTLMIGFSRDEAHMLFVFYM